MAPSKPQQTGSNNDPPAPAPRPTVVIAGGGIAGLVLALALHRHCGIIAEVYDRASSFEEGIGGAIGMYANGLRVIRDINPALLSRLRWEGYPHVRRLWYRHDGKEVARAREAALTPTKSDDDELCPLGIRRWRLLRILYEEAKRVGIRVHFCKCVESAKRVKGGGTSTGADGTEDGNTEVVEVKFCDGTVRRATLLFGADGINSKVRECVVGPGKGGEPEYTGVTVLQGAAPVPRPMRGICYVSSLTTHCHMSTYPTGQGDTVFEVFFPTPVEAPESWGRLSPKQAKKECSELADRLKGDGWSDQFVRGVREASLDSVVRVGLRSRKPLTKWVEGRVALLGDSAHPPVPYMGQGAQMAIEDAGTLALLLKHVCVEDDGLGFGLSTEQRRPDYSTERIDRALELYQRVRVPRTTTIAAASQVMGKRRQGRADSWVYNLYRESSIRLQVFLHGTLPIMYPGAMYDYREDVERLLREEDTEHRECWCD